MEGISIIGIIFVVNIISGISCAAIADSRGVNPGGWFVLGLLLSVTALLFVSIALPNQKELSEKGIEKGTHKKCPYCAEVVRAEALKCRFCHSTLEVEEPPQKETYNTQQSDSFRTIEDMKRK